MSSYESTAQFHRITRISRLHRDISTNEIINVFYVFHYIDDCTQWNIPSQRSHTARSVLSCILESSWRITATRLPNRKREKETGTTTSLYSYSFRPLGMIFSAQVLFLSVFVSYSRPEGAGWITCRWMSNYRRLFNEWDHSTSNEQTDQLFALFQSSILLFSTLWLHLIFTFYRDWRLLASHIFSIGINWIHWKNIVTRWNGLNNRISNVVSLESRKGLTCPFMGLFSE